VIYVTRIPESARSDHPDAAWHIWNDRDERIVITQEELQSMVKLFLAFADPASL